MKNSIYYIINLIICYFFLSYNCQAQIIKNKINIYSGMNLGVFHGKETIKEGSFVYPSLFTNFNYFKGLSIKILVVKKKYYSLGVGYKRLDASSWQNNESNIYNNSKIKQHSLTPIIQLHNKFIELGVYNRIKIFFEIAPAIGLTELTLANPLFDFQIQNDNVSQPMNSSDKFFSIESNTGVEFTIDRVFGIYFAYSFQHSWIKSILYNDNQFSNSQLNLGLVIKIIKDKRYFYY